MLALARHLYDTEQHTMLTNARRQATWCMYMCPYSLAETLTLADAVYVYTGPPIETNV